MIPAALAWTLLVTPVQLAEHEPVCAERAALLASLQREYSEAPKGAGLASNGSVIELLTSSDGKTWTLLVTQPDGTSCVMAAGEAWDLLPQVAEGRPS